MNRLLNLHIGFFIYVVLLLSCSKNNGVTLLEGEWVLQNRFYGDVMMSPCDDNVTDHPKITLTISAEENGTWKVSGKSVINTYFSSFEIENRYDNDSRMKINVNSLGATKIGGTIEKMNCEREYFRLLSEANEIRIVGTTLNWGVFPEPNSPVSRDGGTFLIFKKSK
jgi:heat shock protein HslJ